MHNEGGELSVRPHLQGSLGNHRGTRYHRRRARHSPRIVYLDPLFAIVKRSNRHCHARRWTCDLPGGSVARMMTKIGYDGYRFPPAIIQQAIWLYFRFTLSLRDVEDLLAERGITVSYETVRRWVNHFGPIIAAELRKRRPKPFATWHLDEGVPRKAPTAMGVRSCIRDEGRPLEADRQG